MSVHSQIHPNVLAFEPLMCFRTCSKKSRFAQYHQLLQSYFIEERLTIGFIFHNPSSYFNALLQGCAEQQRHYLKNVHFLETGIK